MQLMNKYTICAGLTLLLLNGCATKTVNVDMNHDNSGAVMGLDYRDFQSTAQEMLQSMIASGAVSKNDGGKYVLVISRIVNDTMQHIDIDQLVKKIRIGLLRSGKVVVTTAYGANGAEDTMSLKTRQALRNNEEFNQNTVAKKGKMIAPDLSLSGKILQKNTRIDSSTQRTIYYFQMTLTDINTGLSVWEDERIIGKQGSNKSVAW